MPITLDDLRRFAVARNFFTPTTLQRALNKLEFVQADPIRAPARAQDLILRHRVRNYRAGELERRYASLDIEEDFFVNYGYVTRSLQALMHPRSTLRGTIEHLARHWPAKKRKQAQSILEFVRERGTVHPRAVDEHFSHGKVTNYWGGSSNATTHLLDEIHYLGLLRVTRREKGIRLYSPQQHEEAPLNEVERRARIDALVDVVVRTYAPLTRSSLNYYIRRLRYAAPQWSDELTGALQRAKQRLASAVIDGNEWYWPTGEKPARNQPQDLVRLLAPFDPLAHDRTRFEMLWGWEYRFEAYTPEPKRKLGYYALPLLWCEQVIGWANLSLKGGMLESRIGYVSTPRDRIYKRELEGELERIRIFLDATSFSYVVA